MENSIDVIVGECRKDYHNGFCLISYAFYQKFINALDRILRLRIKHYNNAQLILNLYIT